VPTETPLRLATLALAIVLAACAAPSPPAAGVLPHLDDWVDCGTVLREGEEGNWDRLLWGGFASSVIIRDGTFLLYYQGSAGYHEEEGTVMNRSIGVASSTDGLSFVRHPANPVITFSPFGNHEEGAVSSAPFLGQDGAVVMYYGANTWAGGEEVNADGRLAAAPDGLSFVDRGIVLSHMDPEVWGGGDEVFPIAAIADGNRRAVYYIPNGTLQRDRLGVAWGDDDELTRTAPATDGGRTVMAWGSGSAVQLDSATWALFTTYARGETRYMEARLVSMAAPNRLSAPIRRYQWPDAVPRAVVRDTATDRWLLYYRDHHHASYGVMVARPGASHPACAT
jgi:hypothetical protein